MEGYSVIYVIADAMKRTQLTGNLDTDRDALRQALITTDMQTAFGKTKFGNWKSVLGEQYTNQNIYSREHSVMAQWRGGQLLNVYPKANAEVDIVSRIPPPSPDRRQIPPRPPAFARAGGWLKFGSDGCACGPVERATGGSFAAPGVGTAPKQRVSITAFRFSTNCHGRSRGFGMETLTQSIVSGLLTGSLFAMIAVGLTIVFGVMRIINMAHGEMVMLGMFGAYWSYAKWRVDPFVAVLIWVPLMFAFGMAVHRFLLRKIIPGGELNALLYTAGLSLLIANLALFLWTGDYRNINLAYAAVPMRPFGISISKPLAIAFIMAVVVMTALYLFLSRTDTGRAIRATAQNPDAAALMGVNVLRIDTITFGLGTALAAAAGVLLVPSLYVYPTVGEILVVKCFVIVVLGGLGSVPGAVAGGLLLGLVESLGAVYVSVAFKDTIGFLLFLLVLLFRPAGLFGVGKS